MISPAYTPTAVNRLYTVELPVQLRGPLDETWDAFVQASKEAQVPVPVDPDFTASLQRVWACSDFVSQTCIHDPDLLNRLLTGGDLLGDYAAGEYLRKLRHASKEVGDVASLGRLLRDFRRQEMLRIAWRDLAGWAQLNEVLHDLSALADACVSVSLDHLGTWATQRLGASARKITPELVVLGMGKLGANELNFSSDIDLIFAYPDDTMVADWQRQSLSADEFYLQLGQQLIQLLGNRTEHGFVTGSTCVCDLMETVAHWLPILMRWLITTSYRAASGNATP